MRRFGAPTARADATLKWRSGSRNKRAVTTDLLQPAGVQQVLELFAKCDVLVENLRPGTLEGWGLAWDALRHRELTGEGRYGDAALYESVCRCTEELAPAFAMYGMVRERAGASHNDVAVPHGQFSSNDGMRAAISCATDLLPGRLARAMGRPELARPETRGEQAIRLAGRHEVNEGVRDWCRAPMRDVVLQRCRATDTRPSR